MKYKIKTWRDLLENQSKYDAMCGVASVHVPCVRSFTRDYDCAVIISGGENMNIDICFHSSYTKLSYELWKVKNLCH
jgi:hypothetical protein